MNGPQQFRKPEIPVLEMRDVTFTYSDRSTPVLSRLRFSIAAGTSVAILGRSGVGKSTLLNLFAGFLLPTSGECRFFGKTVNEPSPRRIPIPQSDGLLPWMTIERNITLRAELDRGAKKALADCRRASELLHQVGLNDVVLREYPKSLSEGMKKRVEFARALYANPDVVLADEPFSNLDVANREAMYRLVKDLLANNHVTFVVATHDIDEAISLADRILLLSQQSDQTKVTEFDNVLTVSDLQQTDGLRASIRAALKGADT